MKTFLSFFSLSFFLFFLVGGQGKIQANGLTTHFQWEPTQKVLSSKEKASEFSLSKGRYQIIAPLSMKEQGEKLTALLQTMDQYLMENYGLSKGRQDFLISLISKEDADRDPSSRTLSSEEGQLTFPFPLSSTDQEEFLSSFATFTLLHHIIKANLAFGDVGRLRVSSHAFRFVDGLSGALALNFLKQEKGVDQKQMLRFLEMNHRSQEAARRYSSQQLLTQNVGSDYSGSIPGFQQFYAGVGLSENPENAVLFGERSSPRYRIQVFQLGTPEENQVNLKKVISFLSDSAEIWKINDSVEEDSFCQTYINLGCSDRSIDGTRADIILYYSFGNKFSNLLKQIKRKQKSQKEFKLEEGEELPAHPVYGFVFPKTGGASESLLQLSLQVEQSNISTNGILEDESLTRTGIYSAIGIQDEVYQILLEISYLSGEKEEDQQLIKSSDLLVGTRLIEQGTHSGWLGELGVYFHWNRLQVEWDTSNLAGKKTDLEYVNRGYYLLDIQNYRAKTFGRFMDLGFNLDVQGGLVNHSGSTSVIKEEKYNKDTSTLVLGVNLGPEIRLHFNSISTDLILGATYHYLWQPFNDEGGVENEEINATQSASRAYASIGISF